MSKGFLTNKKYVWTDREGKKITSKEFMSRWKQGIQNVTPLQQAKNMFMSTWIIIVGVILGIGITIQQEIWWLSIILIGILGVNIIQQIGNYQKVVAYKKIEDMQKEVEHE